ncbi:MAG: cation:proton antiporter, partial [Pseudomonadota bacterium]
MSFGLLALCVLMMLTAFAVALARRLRLPATVLFAAFGVFQGVLTSIFGFEAFGGLLDSYDMWFVSQLGVQSDALLAIFLPPLLFEMAIAVNVRRLLDDAALVLVMAVLAVVFATTAVGGAVWLATSIGLVASLLLGAAVATTDPGAVISTFREIGAPKRLTVLLEGESLLNDAAAIAIYGLLLALLRSAVEPSLAGVLLSFLYDFIVGGAIGGGTAVLVGRFYPLLSRSVAAETSLTMAIAYGAFLLAEMAFSASGVVAVVVAGLVTGTSAYLKMGPGNWRMVQTVWVQIGFWANAIIMILAASLVPGLILEVGWVVVPLVALAYLATLAARAATLFAAAPLLERLRLAEPLETAQSVLVLWGGVRGSVTLL